MPPSNLFILISIVVLILAPPPCQADEKGGELQPRKFQSMEERNIHKSSKENVAYANLVTCLSMYEIPMGGPCNQIKADNALRKLNEEIVNNKIPPQGDFEAAYKLKCNYKHCHNGHTCPKCGTTNDTTDADADACPPPITSLSIRDKKNCNAEYEAWMKASGFRLMPIAMKIKFIIILGLAHSLLLALMQ